MILPNGLTYINPSSPTSDTIPNIFWKAVFLFKSVTFSNFPEEFKNTKSLSFIPTYVLSSGSTW